MPVNLILALSVLLNVICSFGDVGHKGVMIEIKSVNARLVPIGDPWRAPWKIRGLDHGVEFQEFDDSVAESEVMVACYSVGRLVCEIHRFHGSTERQLAFGQEYEIGDEWLPVLDRDDSIILDFLQEVL